MMRHLVFQLAVGVSFLMSAANAEEMIKLETRPGVTVDILYQKAENPAAHLILFEGGPGVFRDLKYPLFLVGTRKVFGGRGFSVAAVNPPSDRNGDMRGGGKFRESSDHLQDIEAVIKWLKKKTDKPVWLIGVSLGTQSVAWIGSATKEPLGGLVFAASKTRGRGTSIIDMELDEIKVPTLLVHHEDDKCFGTPPSGTKSILKGLENSPKAEIKLFEGGQVDGKSPCGPGSHHIFNGMQDEVANYISEFIKTNTK